MHVFDEFLPRRNVASTDVGANGWLRCTNNHLSSALRSGPLSLTMRAWTGSVADPLETVKVCVSFPSSQFVVRCR